MSSDCVRIYFCYVQIDLSNRGGINSHVIVQSELLQ